MWKKIQTQEEVNNIRIGTILIKYPLESEPTNTINLDDQRNFLKYEVHSLNPNTQIADLKIPELDIPSPSQILGLGNVTGIMDNPPVLHKELKKFVTEEKWWIGEN
jgi:hypothetical protein